MDEWMTCFWPFNLIAVISTNGWVLKKCFCFKAEKDSTSSGL